MSAKWYSSKQIQHLTGLSRSSIDRLEKRGRMPQGIRVSLRCVRYPADLIDMWIAGKWFPSLDVEVDHD